MDYNDNDSYDDNYDRDEIEWYHPLRGVYNNLIDNYDRHDIYDKYRYTEGLSNNDTPKVIDEVWSPHRSYGDYNREIKSWKVVRIEIRDIKRDNKEVRRVCFIVKVMVDWIS